MIVALGVVLSLMCCRVGEDQVKFRSERLSGGFVVGWRISTLSLKIHDVLR